MRWIPSFLFAAGVIALYWPGAEANAQSLHYLKPNGGTFAPDGSPAAPWNYLAPAIQAAEGGTVQITGNSTLYETGRFDRPVRLIRNAGEGPVRIGVRPLSETTFRCVAYNTHLSGPGHFVAWWADEARAISMRDYDFGSPDFLGLCEVWNTNPHYNDYLRNIPGMPYGMEGFDLAGDLEHSGLCARSRYPLENSFRGKFSDGVGNDSLASKGWLRARIQKDGFGIWVFMTHAQADPDDSTETDPNPSWGNTYSTRRKQFEQLAAHITQLRESSPNDVCLIMGDFNVFGEDRSPSGSPDQREYSTMLQPTLGVSLGGGQDTARQFFPQDTQFTFSRANSLMRYFYPGTPDSDTARLDYIIALDSADGKVKIQPTAYEVLAPMAGYDITAWGSDILYGSHTDRNLSDHYAVRGDFRLYRIAH
jgi:hypothetical protein